MPGSALTLVEAEVCDSFVPFKIGVVRCRGMRLCEPCTVVQRYASRPVLRQLVHRGGLRADILEDDLIRVGDQVRAVR